MEYVNLGSTGLKVSRLCLGTMTYGSKKWREWVLEEEESRPFIRHALDNGINFFDTADMYSLGVSEEILGRALKDFGPSRDRVVIATKVYNPMGDDVNQRGLSRKHILHAIDDSLRRLGTDYIDLYQFHAGDYPLDEADSVRETLEALVAEGKIRSYGWSTDLTDRAEHFAQGPKCTAIQLQLNVLDDNPEMIALCERHNLAALNRGPLAMGLLTNKYTAETTPKDNDVRGRKSPEWMKYFTDGKPSPEWLAKRDAVREILTSNGRSVAQGAIAWLWARSEKTLPIPGFRTVQQVRDNAGALDHGPLTAAQTQEIGKILEREGAFAGHRRGIGRSLRSGAAGIRPRVLQRKCS